MDTFFEVIFKLIEIAVVCIAVYVAFDIYMFVRSKFESPEQRQSSGAGSEVTGELTTGAKYAIWRYMFYLFGVGGAIIGVVSGVAGYMINDLAKERAIQDALNKMQIPLADRLAQFADAQASLKATLNAVTDEKFKTTVADKLSDDYNFQNKLAKVLVDKYSSQLRGPAGPIGPAGSAGPPGPTGPTGPAGPAGPPGPNGPAGKDGISPTPESVAQSINNAVFRTEIAKVLADQHSTQLRGQAGPTGPAGPAGPPGPVGPAGKDGKDGTNPTAEAAAQSINSPAFRIEIAKVLADQHSTELRGQAGLTGPAGPAGSAGPAGPPGPAGLAGKDGAIGTSPSAASVAQSINDAAFRTGMAKALADQYGAQLRGPAGPAGPPGPVGPAGKDGANGMSPSAASVAQSINDAAFRTDMAKVLADQYGTQLRGPVGPTGPVGPVGLAGKDGRDGKDGVSANVDEIATSLISKHGDQLREILTTRLQPGAGPRRRGGG